MVDFPIVFMMSALRVCVLFLVSCRVSCVVLSVVLVEGWGTMTLLVSSTYLDFSTRIVFTRIQEGRLGV